MRLITEGQGWNSLIICILWHYVYCLKIPKFTLIIIGWFLIINAFGFLGQKL